MRGRMTAMARKARDFMAGLAALAVAAVLVKVRPAGAVTIGELADDAAGEFDSIMGLAQWLFYGLAVFIGGWAILRFKSNLENQQRGGLALPVVGILVAVALASAPALIDAIVEGIGLDRDPGLQKPKFQ